MNKNLVVTLVGKVLELFNVLLLSTLIPTWLPTYIDLVLQG